MSFSVRSALAGGGAALAIVAAATGFLGGAVVEDQAKVVDKVEDVIAAPAGFECPAGFTVTRGDDPHTGGSFVVCENGRYVIRSQDGATPTQAFDKGAGTFVPIGTVQ